MFIIWIIFLIIIIVAFSMYKNNTDQEKEATNKISLSYSKALWTPTKIVSFAEPSELVEDLWSFLDNNENEQEAPWSTRYYNHIWKAIKPWIVKIYLQEVSLDNDEKNIEKDFDPKLYRIDENLNVKLLSADETKKYLNNSAKNLDNFWEIEEFSFITSGMRQSNSFELKTQDDKIYVKLLKFYDNRKFDFIREVDSEVMQKLRSIIEKHQLYKWNWFNKNNKKVLDANWFSLCVWFSSEKQIEASWYLYTPDWYNDFKNDIDQLAIEIIKKYYFPKEEIKSDNLISFSFFEKGATKDRDISYIFTPNSWKIWLNITKWENINANQEIYIVPENYLKEINLLIKKYNLLKWEKEKINFESSIRINASYESITDSKIPFYDIPSESLSIFIEADEQKEYNNFKKDVIKVVENAIKNWEIYNN